MSTYYPDGIPLTPQQRIEDFESANPGMTGHLLHPERKVIRPYVEPTPPIEKSSKENQTCQQ